MHMLMMTALGFAVLIVVFGLSYAVNRSKGRPVLNGLRIFLIVWALVSLWNGYTGVTKAGYSVLAELAVHVVVFGLPALCAWLLARKLDQITRQ
jgi:FtsH-binding integral membrane protein